MAISNSYDFTATRDQVIAGALRILGVIGEGDTPTAEQITTGSEALNMMIKAWIADGYPMWVVREGWVELVAGQAAYNLSWNSSNSSYNDTTVPSYNVNPKKVYQAWYRVGDIDIPMIQLSEQEYNVLGNKTSSGQPIQYFVKYLRTSTTATFYMVPSTAEEGNRVYMLAQLPFSDMDAASDELDFPVEFLRALKFNLASELSFEYGYPTKDRQDLERRAEMYKQQAYGFEQEEESINFQIDVRNW